MIILALETSQRASSVAIRGADGAVHAESLRTERRHDDDLLPAINRLLARCDLVPTDIGGVAISIGPGGFTGLRIAVATTKMLALSLDCAVVAVPSALVVAESTQAPGAQRGLVILASKGTTAWVTPLERRGETWEAIDDGRVQEAREIALDGVDVVFADAHAPAALVERCAAAEVEIIGPCLTAEACLAIAAPRFAAHDHDDPWTLAPLYPRPPEAVTLWERLHAEDR